MNIKVTKPLIFSIILHVILLTTLLFSWNNSQKPQPIKIVTAAIYKTASKNIVGQKDNHKQQSNPVVNHPVKQEQTTKAATKQPEAIKKTPQPKAVDTSQHKHKASNKNKIPADNKKTPTKKEIPNKTNKINTSNKNITSKAQPIDNNKENDDFLAQLLADSKNYQSNPQTNNNYQLTTSQIEQTTANFDGLIAYLVSERWIIPASAVRGMQVEINIEIDTSGRIIRADVVKSSGNLSLDNSAIAAIKSLAIIEEVQNMSPQEFQLIRNRILVFSPKL